MNQLSTRPEIIREVRTTVQLPGQRPSNIFAGWGPKL
jgi:hypothetical protein